MKYKYVFFAVFLFGLPSLIKAQNKVKAKTVQEKKTVTPVVVEKKNSNTVKKETTVKGLSKKQVPVKNMNAQTSGKMSVSSKSSSKNLSTTNLLKPSKKGASNYSNSAAAEKEYMENRVNSKYKITDKALIEKRKKEKADKAKLLNK